MLLSTHHLFIINMLLSTYYYQHITINITIDIFLSRDIPRASGKFLNTSLYKNASKHSPLSHTTQDPKHTSPCSNQRLQPGPCRTSTRTR